MDATIVAVVQFEPAFWLGFNLFFKVSAAVALVVPLLALADHAVGSRARLRDWWAGLVTRGGR